MEIPNNLAVPEGGISDVPLSRGRRIPVILDRTVGYCHMNLKNGRYYIKTSSVTKPEKILSESQTYLGRYVYIQEHSHIY